MSGLFLEVLMFLAFRYTEMSGKVILLSIGLLGMAGMNIMVFGVIRDIAEKKKQSYEKTVSGMQTENWEEMYHSVWESFER